MREKSQKPPFRSTSLRVTKNLLLFYYMDYESQIARMILEIV